jgi:hypothetical protein
MAINAQSKRQFCCLVQHGDVSVKPSASPRAPLYQHVVAGVDLSAFEVHNFLFNSEPTQKMQLTAHNRACNSSPAEVCYLLSKPINQAVLPEHELEILRGSLLHVVLPAIKSGQNYFYDRKLALQNYKSFSMGLA